MTDLHVFLIFVGVSTITDKLLRAIIYLSEGGKHGRGKNRYT